MVENGYFDLMRKFPIDMRTKASECCSLISKKKVTAGPVDVLPLGLGKLGYVLEIDLQKQRSSRASRCVDGCLPRGSGGFGLDSSLGKFDVNWGNFQTLLWKSTSDNLAILYQH